MHGTDACPLTFIGMLVMLNIREISAQTAVASNSGPICTGGTVMLYETGGSAVAASTRATAYNWSYTGTGVTINGNGTGSVTLDFSSGADAGSLGVYGTNLCGDGAASGIDLTLASKTLTLSSLLLEGLYSGAGVMRQARNETGPQFPGGVADHIIVELHVASIYSTVVWSLQGVALSLAWTATLNVPLSYSGSCYITVSHRNSI